MGVWFVIAAIAALVCVLRLIGVVGAIWRERAHVTSECTRMETAASSGVMFCERLSDGTTMLIVPTSGLGQAPTAEVLSPEFREKALR